MHQKLRDIIDLSILRGTRDAIREVLICDMWEKACNAENNDDVRLFVDEAMRLKDERSDVVREWLELESLERVKN